MSFSLSKLCKNKKVDSVQEGKISLWIYQLSIIIVLSWKLKITSWYQENKGMIPRPSITIGLVWTPSPLHASSNLFNFSRESSWKHGDTMYSDDNFHEQKRSIANLIDRGLYISLHTYIMLSLPTTPKIMVPRYIEYMFKSFSQKGHSQDKVVVRLRYITSNQKNIFLTW